MTEMEQLEKKDGRWKQMRVLLIITVISAFAFLSVAEQNFFGRATALIGSVTLLLPNLVNLLSSVAKLFTKNQPSS
jgi:predicted permease